MPRAWIRRNQVPAFLLVTFAWTWFWHGIFFLFGLWDELLYTAIPSVWGPLIGAITVVWAGETTFRSWFRRRLNWRLRPTLYLLAVLAPLFVTNLQPVIGAIGGGMLRYDPPASVGLMVVWVLVNVFVWGGTEEIGWRGFLQPRLQERTSVFTAGLAIGVIWWAWHLPMFLTGDPNYSLAPWAFASYGAMILGISTVLGALVNATDGSALPAMLLHGTTNLGAVIAVSGGLLGGSPVLPLLGGALWWLIVLSLLLKNGPSMVAEPSIQPRV
ncbi:Metal-dependent membrane protease, CAAX family [Halalkaliarchaeum sp. AArc-CO]|uniref:CPBP family intramembrane glutamic endopeptidase n=1 Tax=Halalkaliarchaeum sp. AArc-CO TaxID=2866381 RepID=UPI00217DA158|nr:CPBP family intramembrane glutamic endopeptidase [Halalkaliarchaeum sp. AArc-CO]UWG51366.1 Metal-dependent membrane protease, CAAX family [Halalkaliarchaeum sp. AArc-CO]